MGKFPLHDAWNTLGFGSNEHYAVAKACGKGGMSSEKIPVGKHRPFFQRLLELGLIDDNGNASAALLAEIEEQQALHTASQAVASDLGPFPSEEMKKNMMALAVVGGLQLCPKCNQKVSGMSKCTKTGLYHMDQF